MRFGINRRSIALTGLAGNLYVNSSGVVQTNVTLSNGAGVVLTVPAGAALLASDGTALTSITLTSPGVSPPNAPAGQVAVAIYQFGPDGATFSPPLTLTLPYSPTALPAGAKDADLVIGRWDSSSWTMLTTSVDNQAMTASASITGFSYFALLVPQPPPPAPSPTSSSSPTSEPVTQPPPATVPETSAPSQTATSPSPIPLPTSSPPASSPRNATLVYVLGGGVIIIGIAVVAILFARNSKVGKS